jgi:pimeloyl-ACP methyl ester carboxylesterase
VRALRVTFAACALLLLVPVAAPAALRFSTTSCEGLFECARLRVPLDRSGTVPGTIRLSIERVRAERRRRGAVFALAGGPGQGASSLTESFNRDTGGTLGRRDLIVVDQRGTGRSGVLDCPDLERPSDEPIDVRTARCAQRLGERRRFYTTADTVEDLEAVRAALEIERITLLGVSYGTKVALAYAQTYPEHVERLVLDSVVEPEEQDVFELDSIAAVPRVLDEICRGECSRVTPSLSRDVAELADRMPISGPLVDRRGRVKTREVTARQLYQLIRVGDFAPELRIEYPGAVRAALDGDPAPLVRLEHGGEDAVPVDPPPEAVKELSFTLQATTLCEEAPLPWNREEPSPEERDRQARERAQQIPDARFEPFDRESVLTADNNSLLFQCRRWPAAPARPVPAPKPLPDVPVLVLAGQEDVRTPLEVGTRVAARFPRAQVLAVPKTGHSVLSTARCSQDALRRFFLDRPLGDPCRRVRRTRVKAVPPASADALPGTAAQRTLRAVVLTLLDLNRFSSFGSPRSGGLRAGSYAMRDGTTTFRGFSYVPGVIVDGRLTRYGARGRLRVSGPAAARGTLTLPARGRLVGTLGGERVTARYLSVPIG